MKKCTKCKNFKLLSEFYFRKDKNKYRDDCILCNHKESALYRKFHKKQISNKQKIKHKKYPEIHILECIKDRCINPNSQQHKYYYDKGIKCNITIQEIRYLMQRDHYWDLKNPTIDRIDNDGNYCIENCRFIENIENIRRARSKAILQFDKQSNFIKEWSSITAAGKILNICDVSIGQVCLGKRKSAGGSIWRYKDAS